MKKTYSPMVIAACTQEVLGRFEACVEVGGAMF